MKRNLKALGLAAAAVLAMGVVLTPGAKAEGGKTGEFTAAAYPATITATPLEGRFHEFTIDGGKTQVTCDAKVQGTLAAKSKQLTMTPTYTGCKAHVNGMEIEGVTVAMNGCDFFFTSGTVKSAEEVLGSTKLVCPPTKRVEVTVATCKATITPSHETHANPHSLTTKHPLKGEIKYTNKPENAKTPKPYVELDATVEGITYEMHGAFCFVGENTVKKADGIYHASSLVKGYKDPSTHTQANEVAIDVQ